MYQRPQRVDKIFLIFSSFELQLRSIISIHHINLFNIDHTEY